jgi:hypothetical protein
MDKPTDRFVAVDYQLLDRATHDAKDKTRSTEALAQEMEALRQELESIKKQLGNQNQQQK